MERAIAIDAAADAAAERAGAAGGGAGATGGEREAQALLAGSDAERRAMAAWAARVGDAARAQAVEAIWLRPRSELVLALHAGLGVLASMLAIAAPPVALGLAAVTLLSLLLDLAGLPLSLRRLTPERASQNMLARIAEPPADGVTLILTAHLDRPRGGLLARLGRRPAARWLPGPLVWIVLALLAIAACAAIRLADGDGSGGLLGIVQLVPTLVLMAALGLAIDAALARPAPASADAGPAEALLAAGRALASTPPAGIGVDLVLAGAGTSGGLGFRRHLRRRRPRRDRVAIVELTDGPAPAWLLSDGPLLPLRYHPQLVALAAQAAAEEPQLAAGPARGRALGGALRARQRRLPAIRLAAPTPDALAALALALAELLDESR
ncbi:hypothetical protein Q5424_14840 [Conexibacter sp. JD483]|uniref:hypothetical protein n=1 Tax=unclassified Conexibacter TaxID=2627773 RepID=UPI002725B536|nr:MULTISPECIES: hypothetical protein [unclassified Conexibacter]MDO8188006.1 hypothetical protein [Conexibacter sp. CPCC 205706]MDO8200889.1 hypothetical protein [Conexibacter sp. CPCC 205762]MDR9370378.1 hypothetical protein [Conexibacter sp. JD483]